MREGRAAYSGGPATIGLAAAPPSNRSLNDVQSLLDHDQPGRNHRNKYVGNLPPMSGVFPDYKAPIVRNGGEGRELAAARWGMPSSSKALMDASRKRAEKLQRKAS